jgi:hypothetical protein
MKTNIVSAIKSFDPPQKNAAKFGHRIYNTDVEYKIKWKWALTMQVSTYVLALGLPWTSALPSPVLTPTLAPMLVSSFVAR